VSAKQIAAGVYDKLEELEVNSEYTVMEDHERVTLWNGWAFRIVNDPSDDAPHGISWWLDSPEERMVESGGWELLTTEQLGREVAQLAAALHAKAIRNCGQCMAEMDGEFCPNCDADQWSG